MQKLRSLTTISEVHFLWLCLDMKPDTVNTKHRLQRYVLVLILEKFISCMYIQMCGTCV